jgi:hypothetical protein
MDFLFVVDSGEGKIRDRPSSTGEICAENESLARTQILASFGQEWPKVQITYLAARDPKHGIWVSCAAINTYTGHDLSSRSAYRLGWAIVRFSREAGNPYVFSEHRTLNSAVRAYLRGRRYGFKDLLRFIPWVDGGLHYRNGLTVDEAIAQASENTAAPSAS